MPNSTTATRPAKAGPAPSRQAKPLMRGWIHLGVTPLALAAAIVLLCLADTPGKRWSCGVFLVCSLLLFGISALYHRINWGPRMYRVMHNFDHCNIFLLIAGTYTPIAVSVLPTHDAAILLSWIWGGALAGIIVTCAWPGAPRWVYVPIYILLGWMAIFYMHGLIAGGGWAMVWLLIAGGLSYTLGAVVYGLRWPDPWPRVFGFHEIFHCGTVAGWVCCCIGAYFAVL